MELSGILKLENLIKTNNRESRQLSWQQKPSYNLLLVALDYYKALRRLLGCRLLHRLPGTPARRRHGAGSFFKRTHSATVLKSFHSCLIQRQLVRHVWRRPCHHGLHEPGPTHSLAALGTLSRLILKCTIKLHMYLLGCRRDELACTWHDALGRCLK